ncbi:MAG: hypothetical protein KAW61_08220, partial [candidate division Zixibacteria bacterium]|nr:hypothetical protein [candidate division Zixibacteria bacterium]
ALRVCHQDNFDRYFRLQIPHADFSQSDLEHLLAISLDPEAVVDELRRQHNKGLLKKAIDRIGANIDRIGPDAVVSISQALFAIGEDVGTHDREHSGLFSFPLIWDLSYLSERLFRQISDSRERRNAFISAIEVSEYLYVVTILLNRENLRRSESGHGERLFENDDDLSALKESWLGKVTSEAEKGMLCECNGLDLVLKRWKDWGSATEAQQWVNNAIDSDRCALALLRGFLHYVKTTGLDAEKIQYFMKLEEIEDFVEINILKPKVDAIDAKSLSELHRIAVKIFLEAVRRRDNDDHYDAWSRGDYPL